MRGFYKVQFSVPWNPRRHLQGVQTSPSDIIKVSIPLEAVYFDLSSMLLILQTCYMLSQIISLLCDIIISTGIIDLLNSHDETPLSSLPIYWLIVFIILHHPTLSYIKSIQLPSSIGTQMNIIYFCIEWIFNKQTTWWVCRLHYTLYVMIALSCSPLVICRVPQEKTCGMRDKASIR